MDFGTILLLGLILIVIADSAAQARRVQDVQGELGRRLANLGEELKAEQVLTRRFLAMMAAGEAPTRGMVEEGLLWRDATGDEARALVDESGARVLDVRTPSEVETGAVPGALKIPVDELPERLGEIPDDGRPLLVYCAAGARSAAACELLSQRGFRGPLHNLAGGIGAWPGALER